jgi:hypothetical protein
VHRRFVIVASSGTLHAFSECRSVRTYVICLRGARSEERGEKREFTAPWPWEEIDRPAVRTCAERIPVVFPEVHSSPKVPPTRHEHEEHPRALSQSVHCMPAICPVRYSPRAVPREEKFSRHALHTAPVAVARGSRHYESCPFLDQSLHSDICQAQRSTNCFT